MLKQKHSVMTCNQITPFLLCVRSVCVFDAWCPPRSVAALPPSCRRPQPGQPQRPTMMDFSTLCLVLSLTSSMVALLCVAVWIVSHRWGWHAPCAGGASGGPGGGSANDVSTLTTFYYYLLLIPMCSDYHTVCLDDEDLEDFLDRPYG